MRDTRPVSPGSPIDLMRIQRGEVGPRLPGAPSPSLDGLSVDDLRALLSAIWRRGNLITVPFIATNAGNPIKILSAEPRSYFFIQNQSGANNIIVNFGRPPGAAAAVPADGVIIGAGLGGYEPICVPQDDVYVFASAAATPGVIVYARTDDIR